MARRPIQGDRAPRRAAATAGRWAAGALCGLALVAAGIALAARAAPVPHAPHAALVADEGAGPAALLARDRQAQALAALQRDLRRCGAAGSLAGRRLRRFWDCANVPIRQQVLRGRIEGPLAAQLVQDLTPGRCRLMAGAMAQMEVALGDTAYVAQLTIQQALFRPAPGRVRRSVDALRHGVRDGRRLLAAPDWRACSGHDGGGGPRA